MNLISVKVVGDIEFVFCTTMTVAAFGIELELMGKDSFCGCFLLQNMTIPMRGGLLEGARVQPEACTSGWVRGIG